MPIYRDHYTRGSEIKATARSKISSFTSGLLYGVFHFFTPVFCLPSEQLTDNIQNLLGGVFQVSCYSPPFLFRQIYTPVFLPSEQLEDLFKEFKIRSSVRLHVFRLLSDCPNFYQKPFGGVSICNSSFTDESHYDLMTQSS